ncbi:helix-turn-helix domain-containing protein [Bacillus cereus]|uniref:helix-turn-helix domain-containing protein n=1 Tax=Bacillus cereus TaxID=1396 RepID=UPI00027ABA9A|nr:helix-turn-helix domain-containing protein [Bacillus cereus]EJS77926.1 hypothetical protein ICY_00779 [Bacillus cereus BAG2X1-3]
MTKAAQAKAKKDFQKELNRELKAITADHDTNPFYDKNAREEGDGFIKKPASIMDYLALQEYGFTADTIIIYDYIVQLYNPEYGCAFPSQYAIAEMLHKSVRTVANNLKILQDVGLIEVIRRGLGLSNGYRPLRPLKKSELFKRYPRAAAFHNDFAKSIDNHRNKDKAHRTKCAEEYAKAKQAEELNCEF